MSYHGGLNQVVTNLVNAFADKYNIHLISLSFDGSINFKLDSRVKFSYLSDAPKRLMEMRRTLKHKLRDYIIKNDIEIAVIEGDYPGFICSTLRYTTNAKLIFHEHGSIMSQWNQKDIVFIRWFSALFSHRTVTLTERNRSDYLRKFHFRKRKILAIPNWIAEFEGTRIQYDLNSKKIIAAGRLRKEKGFLMLLQAYRMIAEKNPEWQLDIYGDGEEKGELEEYIETNNLSAYVKLKGWKDYLFDVFGNYSFLVMTSYREGFPLILLEAKQAKLPIISFDILTGPREIIEDGVDGILIKPYDINRFSEAMQIMMNDDDLRQRLSDNADKTLHKYSKETISDLWNKLFDEM